MPVPLTFRKLDSSEFIDTLTDFFMDDSGHAPLSDQLVWKYLETPKENDVTIWAACSNDGEVLAMTGTLARHYFHDGKPYTAHQLSDSFVKKDAQRQGIYQRFINHIITELNEINSKFLFGFTNDRSSGALLKINNSIELYGNKVMVLPLGGKNLSSYLPNKLEWFFQPAINISVKGFNWINRLGKTEDDLRLETIINMDDLPERLCISNSFHYHIYPKRSALFLNWKAMKVPQSIENQTYRFWFLDGEDKVGYCVLYDDKKKNRLKIIDLVCTPEPSVMRRAISAITNYAKNGDFDLIMMIVSGSSYVKTFKKSGYFQTRNVRCSLIAINESKQSIEEAGDDFWYQAPIDRDNFHY